MSWLVYSSIVSWVCMVYIVRLDVNGTLLVAAEVSENWPALSSCVLGVSGDIFFASFSVELMCMFCENCLCPPWWEDWPLSSSESNLCSWCSSASHSLFVIFLSLAASQTVLYRPPPPLLLLTPLVFLVAPLHLQQTDTRTPSLPFWNLDNLRQYHPRNRPSVQWTWWVESDHLMRDRIGIQLARDCGAQSEE